MSLDKRKSRKKKTTLADKIGAINIHDDNLVAITMQPSTGRRTGARVEIRLRDDADDGLLTLSFLQCGNLRLVFDFDVLASNSFAQTRSLRVDQRTRNLLGFVRKQRSVWHTRYMPPSRPDLPIRAKISGIGVYALYCVRFFGGKLEVLARGYRLTKSSDKKTRKRR